MRALGLLFFASGCAALIYEMVWFYLVQLVVGASSISVAVLLSAFMGGMALGSCLLPRSFPINAAHRKINTALRFMVCCASSAGSSLGSAGCRMPSNRGNECEIC